MYSKVLLRFVVLATLSVCSIPFASETASAQLFRRFHRRLHRERCQTVVQPPRTTSHTHCRIQVVDEVWDKGMCVVAFYEVEDCALGFHAIIEDSCNLATDPNGCSAMCNDHCFNANAKRKGAQGVGIQGPKGSTRLLPNPPKYADHKVGDLYLRDDNNSGITYVRFNVVDNGMSTTHYAAVRMASIKCGADQTSCIEVPVAVEVPAPGQGENVVDASKVEKVPYVPDDRGLRVHFPVEGGTCICYVYLLKPAAEN